MCGLCSLWFSLQLSADTRGWMLMILGSMQQVGSDGIDGFTNLSGTTSFGFSSSEIQSDVLRHRRHQQLVLASLDTPSLHQMLVFFILEGIMHAWCWNWFFSFLLLVFWEKAVLLLPASNLHGFQSYSRRIWGSIRPTFSRSPRFEHSLRISLSKSWWPSRWCIFEALKGLPQDESHHTNGKLT